LQSIKHLTSKIKEFKTDFNTHNFQCTCKLYLQNEGYKIDQTRNVSEIDIYAPQGCYIEQGSNLIHLMTENVD
jgi:hypothetical protein